jgi:hypothetical protein
MAGRLNARIDARLAKKVATLRRVTGQTTTDVVRVALERYHDSIERETRPYELLLEGGLIGCAEGPVDLSVTYKDDLARSLDQKYGEAPAATRPARKKPRRTRKRSVDR